MKGLSRRGLGRTQYPWRECFLPQRISLHVGRGAAPLPARCRRLDLRLEIGQRRALVTLRSRLGSALSYVCASLRPGGHEALYRTQAVSISASPTTSVREILSRRYVLGVRPA